VPGRPLPPPRKWLTPSYFLRLSNNYKITIIRW
jgi:hypothetical protein